jgi:hypothetical protein
MTTPREEMTERQRQLWQEYALRLEAEARDEDHEAVRYVAARWPGRSVSIDATRLLGLYQAEAELRALEWSWFDSVRYCGACHQSKARGHRDDCVFRALPKP